MNKANPFARRAAAARGDLAAQRGFILKAVKRLGIGSIAISAPRFTPELLQPSTEADARAQDMAALQLAYDLANELDAPAGNVWYSLCNLPLNVVGLLNSPHGWSALSGLVALDLGMPIPAYMPTVH